MQTTTRAYPICLFGVPMDLGQNRRGVDMGPSAIRYAGLQARLERLGWQVRDAGNLPVPIKESVMADAHRPKSVMNNFAPDMECLKRSFIS